MAGQANNEIRATLAVSQQEAFIGTTRTLTLTGGRQITVTIPAGCQHGQEIHLAGPGAETLILTLTIAPAGTQAPSASYPPSMAPSSTPYSIPPPSPIGSNPNSSGQNQFIRFTPGAQTPYPPSAFSNGQTYPAPSQPGIASYPPYSQPGIANYPTPSQPGITNYPAPSQPGISSYPPYSQPGIANYPAGLPAYAQVAQGTMNPPIPVQPPTKKKRPIWLYNILILTTLFLIVTSALFYLFGSYVPTQQKIHATATAQGVATSDALTQASATSEAISAATSQANTTATALAPYINTYNKIVGGTPSLNDNLNAPNLNNWDTNTTCTFQNGSYHIIENQNGYFRDCFAEAPTFNNFAFQVQMTILKGDAGGLVFRANPTTGKLYLFVIGADGSYSLYYYPDETGKTALRLEDGTTTALTLGYNHNNLIMVLARGNTIDLYINKNYVSSIQDNALTNGKIGVIANFQKSITEVTYNQAKVWKL